MKYWHVELSENGWEYTGHIFIAARSCKQVSSHTLKINGATVMYDEVIKVHQIAQAEYAKETAEIVEWRGE